MLIFFDYFSLETLPTLFDLLSVLKDKSSEWNAIGCALNISFNERENLRKDVSRNPEQKLEAILNHWMEASKSPVTWEAFRKALVEMEFMDCVRAVERKFNCKQ